MKIFPVIRLVIYTVEYASKLRCRIYVEFYLAKLLISCRNFEIECGSNPSSDSRWSTLIFILPKKTMHPERATMMVALPLFGYKLPQMYIDMTILHDSTTWYIYEYITTVVVDESIHFLPYSKGVNTIIKRPFSAQPSTRPASLIEKKT